jgi:Xaa-Pro aminopeptidase
LSAFEYATRVKRLHEQMVDGGVDVTLLSVGADLPYFTGYEAMPSERLTVLVVPASQDPVLFVPELEAPRVEGGDFEMRAWGELDDPVELVSSLVTSPDTVAVGDHMWSIFLTRFQKHWIGASWIPASEITRPLRMRKDRGEIDLLHEAAHAVDRVMARIPAEVRFSGRTESDVARDLAGLTVEEGHERAEFTIVASGPNAASPHHEPGDRAGREAVAPDVPCQEIDRAARRVVTDAGYGPYFIHRTGHGIGLEVHEHPYVVEGNETPLEPGMTFSVEPGIYLPGEFGVRIEDIVVCTEEAGESLNRAERGLIPVG